MAKVLILYYSAYGHIEAMAYAVADGARAGGATADVKCVPKLVPDDVAAAAHFKTDQAAPVASVAELEHYDAIVIGTGTRYGRISSQMASFLDPTGALWARDAFVGKVGSAFTASGTQHGGQETTALSIVVNLLHYGMIIVGLPSGYKPAMIVDRVVGGTPYGASTIAALDGSRRPSEIELAAARHQGQLVAQTAGKLFG